MTQSLNQAADKRPILIGIPVLDNIEITRACLSSLMARTETGRLNLAVRVLVIDNGSSDDITGLVKNEFASARFPVDFIRHEANTGVAPAWNEILEYRPDALAEDYEYIVVSNNDVIYGPDWLQPLIEIMDRDKEIGWLAPLENGSPVLGELVKSHAFSCRHRVDPKGEYTTASIEKSVEAVYHRWGGHQAFCNLIRERELPGFIPFGRSAVCFMVRTGMISHIGLFDEAYPPIGLAEDLEYFCRMAQLIRPPGLTEKVYPPGQEWKFGLCGASIIHHNWAMTRQGRHFDGAEWDRMREVHWQKKFPHSRQHYTDLLPTVEGTIKSGWVWQRIGKILSSLKPKKS